MVWFFVTVMVPLLAPFILVPIFWILPISAHLKVDAKLVALAKDGQLCWVAMGFCVSGLYDPLRSKFLLAPFGIGITSI